MSCIKNLEGLVDDSGHSFRERVLDILEEIDVQDKILI